MSEDKTSEGFQETKTFHYPVMLFDFDGAQYISEFTVVVHENGDTDYWPSVVTDEGESK